MAGLPIDHYAKGVCSESFDMWPPLIALQRAEAGIDEPRLVDDHGEVIAPFVGLASIYELGRIYVINGIRYECRVLEGGTFQLVSC